MTGPMLYDITRSVWRRWRQVTPSGIDRVCDAYAANFAGEALAVLQLRGRSVVLNRSASATLFTALDAPTAQFRRDLITLLARLPWCMANRQSMEGATYLNVGHSDFDLDAHWQSIRKRGLKSVYLLHDLIPLTHPHITTAHKVARHRGRVVKALENADGIIVNSRATEADLHDFADRQALQLPPLLVAPIAGGNLPVPLRPAAHDKPVFVSVGTIEARKNHMLLLRTWSLLIDRLGDAAPRLVLAGSWGLRSKEVRSALKRDPRLGEFIHVRTGLNDSELASLMAGSRGVLLPTLAEGYGLPMVEALRLQTPVIATDLPSFREIGQGIPTLLSPTNVEAWAEAIADFCDNGSEQRRQLAVIGKFQPPTWRAHFAKLDEWLANLSALDRSARLDRADQIGNEMTPTTATRQNREAQC